MGDFLDYGDCPIEDDCTGTGQCYCCAHYDLTCSDMRDLLAFAQAFASAEIFIARTSAMNARALGQAKAILSILDNSQTFGSWV